MDRSKLAAFGERLKTGGAQMSRKFSGKMKEFLQVQTVEGKLVDEATSDNLQEPNWGINLRICVLLNSEELSGLEVMKSIKKKISGKNMTSVRLSLDLLEVCAMNCEKVFSEIASEKVLEEMVMMIKNPQTHYSNRERALQLIKAWGESPDLGYLPVFQQTYLTLKESGISSAAQSQRNLDDLLESSGDQTPLHPPIGYPTPSIDEHSIDQIPIAYYHSVNLSEEEKKETLITARNSIELLSSLLNSEAERNSDKDDLTESMVLKCKQLQTLIQRIIEGTTYEALLIEALTVNEELQQVLSRCSESVAVTGNREPALKNVNMNGCSNTEGEIPIHETGLSNTG